MSLEKNNPPMAWVEIDLARLRGNLRAIRRIAKKSSSDILAVVKANAYGHGMQRIAQELYKGGVRFFGVANITEALQLKKAIPGPIQILTLGTFHSQHVEDYVRHQVIPTVSCLHDMDVLEKCVWGKRKFPVHIKVDTGMGRLGVLPDDLPQVLAAAKSIKALIIEGIYTHFSSADDENAELTEHQLELFQKALQVVNSMGIKPQYVHAANSMAFLRFSKTHFNLARPGILLYGLKPSPNASLPQGVRSILSLKSRISFLKSMKKGMTVSYGRTHTLTRNTTIATLPIGYSHGYRVAFSNQARVIVGGKLCPVVGRVTMDETLVDVGSIRKVRRWDEVCLIGESRVARVTVEELARLGSTIPYEITCAIHPRLTRIYTHEK